MRRVGKLMMVAALLAVAVVVGVVGVVPAFAGSSWWHVTSGARPAYISPEGKGEIVLSVANLGDGSVNAATVPVAIVDRLPAGLKATSIAYIALGTGDAFVPCSLGSLTCTFSGSLPPYHQIEVVIHVEAQPGAESGDNTASVTGGETPPASGSSLVTISEAPPLFGLEDYEMVNEEPGGISDTQAGSHPFQTTFTVNLNQTFDAREPPVAVPVALPKDIDPQLPAGWVGNPVPFARCTIAQFLTFNLSADENGCSPQTAVGVATVHAEEPFLVGNAEYVLPVFNLQPSYGEPARLGFYIPEDHIPIFIDTSVRGGPGTGEEYALSANVDNISQTAAALSSQVTIWGVPGSPEHDMSRGWGCLHEAEGLRLAPCQPLGAEHPQSFVTLPTTCAAAPQSSVQLDSWAEPANLVTATTSQPMPTLDGCNQLVFNPLVQALPTTVSASSASGLKFSLGFVDEGLTSAEGRAQSQLKDTVVTLPEGFTINPSSGVGLGGCTPAGFAAETIESPPGTGCPNDSKLGTVEASTPLLTQTLEGSLFIAQPYENPFPEPEAGHLGGTLVALYIVLKNPETGVMIKLAGKVTPNPVTGRLTTSFVDNPQFPISHFNFHFREGQQAPLITPATCGTYTTKALLTPWSEPQTPTLREPSFTITSGVGGGPCPSGGTAPFSPGIEAGTLNNNAGTFSSFYLHLTRGDGDQEISGFSTDMPNGLTGRLTGIPYCPQASIEAARHVTGAQEEAEPSCPAASEIGHTLVGTGVGAVLAYVPGKVYLAGPYSGDPFSIVSITSAKVGPFDLGTVVLRFALAINPRTAQVSVDPTASEPIPTIIDGIVTHVRDIGVYIDRPGFIVNPTGCEAKSISSTLTAGEGATATVSSPFQAASCANLKFTPKIAVSTGGHASKLDGASLAFKISYPAGALGTQSWFKETKFDIPKQLPARLETLQRSCLAKVFEANPAGCPPAATIGHATVHTPLLPVPLAGPVYFVSYGGAKFPEAVIVLQGDGVTFDLHGETFINKKTGVTSATFRNTPDVPFENIEVTIPTGRYSEFGANVPAKDYYNLCGQKLTMPTLLKAQNGLQINQNTPITITGCTKPKPKKHAKPKKHK
jgi:hypothetical protein